MPRITGLADSPMTNELACGQDSWGRASMEAAAHGFLWIDDFAGHFGTVVILPAGSLYGLLGASNGCSTSSLRTLGCDVEPILFCEARLHNSHLIGGIFPS
jgi:hypothetical protein